VKLFIFIPSVSATKNKQTLSLSLKVTIKDKMNSMPEDKRNLFFGNLLGRLQKRRARRGEAKEQLLGYDEEDLDPEQTREFWETTIDGEPVEVIQFNIQYSAAISTIAFDNVHLSSETSADHKVQRDPAPSSSRLKRVQRQASMESSLARYTMDSSAKTKEKVKEAEDVLQGSNQKRAKLQPSNSFQRDPPGGAHKRAPPKKTLSLDAHQFNRMLVQNQIPHLPNEVKKQKNELGMTFQLPESIEVGPQPPVSPMKISRRAVLKG
jgi:hypothetical protein